MAAVSFVTHSKHLALFAVIAFSFIIAVTDGCSDDDDCDIEMNQVCCNSECVYESSCVGRYCTSDTNCSSSESCCSSECTSGDCWGSSCSNDSDCGDWGRCCYGTCQYAYDECYEPLSAFQLVLIIIGSLFFTCLIAVCICGRIICSSNDGQTYWRIRSRRTTTPATVTTTSSVAHPPTNPPQRVTKTIYTRRVVHVQRSYQQGYPYYPPPQQTTNRPPKIDNTLAVIGQPPPYTATPQGRSGGVYAPQPSYGAIQSSQVV